MLPFSNWMFFPNIGPAYVNEWNSPFSPQGSTADGSSARNPSSNSLPAKLLLKTFESMQTTIALKPVLMNSRAMLLVSFLFQIGIMLSFQFSQAFPLCTSSGLPRKCLQKLLPKPPVSSGAGGLPHPLFVLLIREVFWNGHFFQRQV